MDGETSKLFMTAPSSGFLSKYCKMSVRGSYCFSYAAASLQTAKLHSTRAPPSFKTNIQMKWSLKKLSLYGRERLFAKATQKRASQCIANAQQWSYGALIVACIPSHSRCRNKPGNLKMSRAYKNINVRGQRAPLWNLVGNV